MKHIGTVFLPEGNAETCAGIEGEREFNRVVGLAYWGEEDQEESCTGEAQI